MSDFENIVHRCIERFMAGRYNERPGLVSSYDPKTHTAKVKIQPEGQETGNLPINALHIGNGFGILSGLKPSDQGSASSGDQVFVNFLGGDLEAGRIVGRLHSDVDKPPPVEAGEILVKHEKAGSMFWSKDGKLTLTGGKGQAAQNQGSQPNATSKPGAPGSDYDQTVAKGGHTLVMDADGNIKVTGVKGQSTLHDPQGNITHTLQPSDGSSPTSGFSFIVDALKDITHKAGGSQTRQAGQTITDVATSITHTGNTSVTGTLGVSQLLSALGGAQFGLASFTIDSQGRIGKGSFAPRTGAGSLGDIIYRDSDFWVPLAPNNAGYVLTTGGVGVPPFWAPTSQLASSNYLGAFIVALLPANPPTWSTAFATDAPKTNEVSGSGTGVPVYYQNGWKTFSADQPVKAGGGVGGGPQSGTGASSTFLGTFTVAGLPPSPATWSTAFAVDAPKINEVPGSGTGIPCYFQGGLWRTYSSDQPIQAGGGTGGAGGGVSNFVGSYTVLTLPIGPPIGSTAFASNGREIGDPAGFGTGCPVYFNGAWRTFSTGNVVQS